MFRKNNLMENYLCNVKYAWKKYDEYITTFSCCPGSEEIHKALVLWMWIREIVMFMAQYSFQY